jgi:hypothetical protein
MGKTKQETAREFVFQKLAEAGSSGVSILDLLAAAEAAHLSTRLLKHVLHDEEASGSLRRDWNRRYVAVEENKAASKKKNDLRQE